ncbi:MAG: redoxin family protein [Flavobacteriales bacterium]|nr:redoxin family protein [Flavobacteriales bacterium]
MKQSCVILSVLSNVAAFGQLPDGSTAPDFTLVDYFGGTHNLYSYLDAGKTVFVEIFAAHCPTCWAYHQTHRLKNLYEAHGPDGSDELMVLALEYDQWNDSNAFTGNHEPWVTAGDWLTGTPYPIFNVEDPDRGVFTDYNVTYYPVIYKVCPDRTLERVFTSHTETQLYQMVQACQATIGMDEWADPGDILYDPRSRSLLIERFSQVQRLLVIDLQGRVVQRQDVLTTSTVQLVDLPTGVYQFCLGTAEGQVVRRFYVER